MHNFDVEVFDYGWPLLLIGAGAYLVYRAMRKRSGAGSSYSEVRILGDSSHDSISGEIDGTEINHFIGDTDLNLTGAQLKPGINTLKLAVFIGDIEVFIPKGMEVEASFSAFIGDLFVLKRHQGGIFVSVTEKTEGYDTAEKKLHIEGNAFIGDIKIRELETSSGE
jgi:lia operon protein LiaF